MRPAMSQHQLHAYPDIPKAPAQKVVLFDISLEKDVEALTNAISEYQLNCIAAPHLNLPFAIFVIQSDNESSQPNIYINPQIVAQARHKNCITDCLFFPYTETVIKRPLEIELAYQDINGANHKERFEAQKAILISYLTDCLNGKTVLDYMSQYKKQRFLGKFKKSMQRNHTCDSNCTHEH